MAVQQNKKSPSKRGMHRAHDFLTNPPLAVEPTTGEVHLRHHISPSGYYRGRKIVKTKADKQIGSCLRRTELLAVRRGPGLSPPLEAEVPAERRAMAWAHGASRRNRWASA